MSHSTIQRDYLAARASLLEVAAFLDRTDRAGESDYHKEALRNAMHTILQEPHDRARHALESLSDMSEDIPIQASKPYATGAHTPNQKTQQ